MRTRTQSSWRALLVGIAVLVEGNVQRGAIAATFTQQAYVKASNCDLNDEFGISVAVSGDTVVVAAPGEDSNATGVNGNGAPNRADNSGAVYVYVRTGTVLNPIWTQQAYLRASNTDPGDAFGQSVAISGDTIVVGAPFEDSNANTINGNSANNILTNSGAAYVFVRSGTTWTQQAYLKPFNPGNGDLFGYSVAVSGDTIVVGAPSEDSDAIGVNNSGIDRHPQFNAGAAYVFVRNGTNWTQQAYVKASNTDTNDQFGTAVAISANTVVVGAPGESSNATGVNGDGNNNLAFGSGAAYIFVRSGTTWTQQAYLKASNTDVNDEFGQGVAVSGDTVVVGAPLEDSNATGVNGDGSDNSAHAAGAAYVFFFRNGPIQFGWIQRAYLKASNTDAFDEFGLSVSISGSTIVVGARNEDSNANGVNGNGGDNSASISGAAYTFVRGGTVSAPTWSFRDYLKASNTGADDRFGVSVGISKGTVVVGAFGEASAATGINGDGSNDSMNFAGAAYIFEQTSPDILVEQPVGADVADGGSRDFIVIGTNYPTLTFTIRNGGNDFLNSLALTIDGADAAMFNVTTNPAPAIGPGLSTSFSVRFVPTSGGPKTAALHIVNNDTDKNPFDITLNGYTLTFNQDTDGDGLSDAAEFLLAPLGFDWKVSQPALVNNLLANSNGAGLFTQAQVQALNVDTPLLSKNLNTGLFKLTIGVQKATHLTNFAPFPMSSAQTGINAEGNLEFQFSAPDNAAFFRLESR